MKIITAKWLESAGACESAVADFRKTFGESCPLDARNAALWIERLPNDASDDFRWLALQLMDSFDIDTLVGLERRLAIEPKACVYLMERINSAVDALLLLEDDQLAKVIEEIADRSTALDTLL
jgi:hypothetical protein